MGRCAVTSASTPRLLRLPGSFWHFCVAPQAAKEKMQEGKVYGKLGEPLPAPPLRLGRIESC
jgi:hypothetical protein